MEQLKIKSYDWSKRELKLNNCLKLKKKKKKIYHPLLIIIWMDGIHHWFITVSPGLEDVLIKGFLFIFFF